jgi:hypothetical protein
MFRALLAHPQEAPHNRNLAYCVRVMSVMYSFVKLLNFDILPPTVKVTVDVKLTRVTYLQTQNTCMVGTFHPFYRSRGPLWRVEV